MPNKSRIDFDGQARRLVEDAYTFADTIHTDRNAQFERDYLAYRAYIDMTGRNADMPQIALPKIYSLVETKAPKDVKALFGRRPVMEWDSKRDEFQEVAEAQVAYFDELMAKAGLFSEAILLTKLKTLYGTAFMSMLPVYEKIVEKQLIPDGLGGFNVREKPAHRLRLKLETWAPWEVMVDPYAAGLENVEDCRYLIKIQLASKRMIRLMAQKGAYPNFDLDEMERRPGGSALHSSPVNQHIGLSILSRFGLSLPEDDDDMGILLRYESPDRYIDYWSGYVLRDQDNEWDHKGINCSRMIHTMSPHTQERFWGIGEAKPNEIQAAMLNDIYSMTLGTYGMMSQPVMAYRKGVVEARDLIWSFGNRIPVGGDERAPLRNSLEVIPGMQLPADHYALLDRVERNMDLTARNFSLQRGETARGGTDTATEIALLKESGDESQELIVKTGELMFLADLAKKGLSIISQYGNMNDFVEILGEEQGMLMILSSPADLPGGFNFTFKGSDRVANLMIKQRNMKELAAVVLQSPAAKPTGFLRMLLDVHDFTTKEQDQMVMSEEEWQMQQMMMMMAQAGAGGQGGSPASMGGGRGASSGQPGGRFAVNDSQGRARQIIQQTLANAGGQGGALVQ